MTEISVLKFVHLLLFVYWLGGDLGVFYSSSYIVKSELSVEARQTAAKIMFWLDQGPKICMTMILPTGVHLASALGYLSVHATALALIWLVCLCWFANVNAIHLTKNKARKQQLERIDLWFRAVLIIVLSGLSIYALLTDRLIPTDWVAVKLLSFAALVACGLIIRILLQPFMPAFATLSSEGASVAGDETMRRSLHRCRYFVVLIWILLLFNAAIGVHLLHF